MRLILFAALILVLCRDLYNSFTNTLVSFVPNGHSWQKGAIIFRVYVEPTMFMRGSKYNDIMKQCVIEYWFAWLFSWVISLFCSWKRQIRTHRAPGLLVLVAKLILVEYWIITVCKSSPSHTHTYYIHTSSIRHVPGWEYIQGPQSEYPGPQYSQGHSQRPS